jgi:hypothetical protein
MGFAVAFQPIPHRVSTPRRTEVLLSAVRYQTHHSFRPRGFSPPRQLAPHAACRFVAPYYRSKVRFVSHSRPRSLCPKTQRRLPTVFPEPQLHTPRRIPLIHSVLCHHSRCLPAVFTGCHSLLLAEAHNTSSLPISRERESRPLEIHTDQHRSARCGS